MELLPLNSEARAFAAAYVEAWAADVASDPPPGPVLRVLMDWNTDGVGRSFSYFAVGEDDALSDGYYSWAIGEERYDDENGRTWEVFGRPKIAALYEAWERTIPATVLVDGYETSDDFQIVRSLAVALGQAAHPALEAHGVTLSDRFTVKADLFVDSADRSLFEYLNSPEVIEELRTRGELPDCYD